MENRNELSDQDINHLLRQRLLQQEDDALLEAEATYVFASPVLVVPDPGKEQELLEKCRIQKAGRKSFKWIIKILTVASIVILGICSYTYLTADTAIPKEDSKNNSVTNENTTPAQSLLAHPAITDMKEYPQAPVNPDEYNYSDKRGQIVESIEKENADCNDPILITDTVITSLESPRGIGNELEFFDNSPDDALYVEKEHHTVWYKFWAKEDCDLAFDIIPFNKNDDYDFMLFKWPGGDFRSKVISKKLKPLRTCISRNDKSINSMTGLSFDEPKQLFIHSGAGVSYVKYISVNKGETYYLMLDNVYPGGQGHRICFHYKCHKPDEIYVGKRIPLDSIYYKSDDYQFKTGSGPALQKILRFMQENPLIQIEVEGHVNTNKFLSPGRYGKDTLSLLRANAIKKFLVQNGIATERIISVGYGDRRKVVKDPKIIKEYLMNMRSSIMIISMDYTKSSKYKR